MADFAPEVQALVERIRPLLAGRPPEIQGAALADLTAIWLAGHLYIGDRAATDRLREELFSHHIAAVRDLIPVNAKIIAGDG